MIIAIFGFVISISVHDAVSQNVGINITGTPPNTSAGLDVDFTNKGLLIPRVALTQTTSNAPIGAGVATSLLVYNTATINDVTPGYYYWDGTVWVRFMTVGASGDDWKLLGNAGTVDGTHFLGTTDNVALSFRVNNQKAGRIDQAGPTYLGYQAGNVSVSATNTGVGYQAMYNTVRENNTAVGYQAMFFDTDGADNTAIGYCNRSWCFAL